jgi:hypothetical protein
MSVTPSRIGYFFGAFPFQVAARGHAPKEAGDAAASTGGWSSPLALVPEEWHRGRDACRKHNLLEADKGRRRSIQ